MYIEEAELPQSIFKNLGLVTPSLKVEDTHLSSLIISTEVFVFLSSQFLSELNCTD